MGNSNFLFKRIFIWDSSLEFFFTLWKLNWHKFTTMSDSNFLFEGIFIWDSSLKLFIGLRKFDWLKFSTLSNSDSFTEWLFSCISFSKLSLIEFDWMKRLCVCVLNSNSFSYWFITKAFCKRSSLGLNFRNQSFIFVFKSLIAQFQTVELEFFTFEFFFQVAWSSLNFCLLRYAQEES
jgi:hypothetical protein